MLNVFEAVDVIELIKGGQYESLSSTVGEALQTRADVSCTCQEWLLSANDAFVRTSRVSTVAQKMIA